MDGHYPGKKMHRLHAHTLAACGDWAARISESYKLVLGYYGSKATAIAGRLLAWYHGTQQLTSEQLLQRFGFFFVEFRNPTEPICILHLSFHEFVTGRAAKMGALCVFTLVKSAQQLPNRTTHQELGS